MQIRFRITITIIRESWDRAGLGVTLILPKAYRFRSTTSVWRSANPGRISTTSKKRDHSFAI